MCESARCPDMVTLHHGGTQVGLVRVPAIAREVHYDRLLDELGLLGPYQLSRTPTLKTWLSEPPPSSPS